MKLPLLVTLAFLPCLALAQSTTDTASSSATNQPSGTGPQPWHHHHHFSPEKQLARLTAKLGLSVVQQEQIKPLLVSRDAQLKAIHENAGLAREQKREQSHALFKSTGQQIESFLTPAQVQTFEQLHQHHAKPAR